MFIVLAHDTVEMTPSTEPLLTLPTAGKNSVNQLSPNDFSKKVMNLDYC